MQLSNAPLVSCVMVTSGRPQLVRQAIRYLKRQTYPHVELIVVSDDSMSLAALPAQAPFVIRRCQAPPGLSIGAQRNLAGHIARGEIVMHWDDDDWFGPDRIRTQVAPLLAGEADVSGLQDTTFYDLATDRCWQCTPAAHRRLFVGGVHGGTLAYKRSVWSDGRRFPDCSLGEDGVFLRRALDRGARLQPVPAKGNFLYVRHAGNAWGLRGGDRAASGDWYPVDRPPLPAEDATFYSTLRADLPQECGEATSEEICTDPLGRAEILLPRELPPMKEALAVVVSPGYEDLAGCLIDSFRRRGGCPEARVVLLAHGDSGKLYRLIDRHQALRIRWRPRAPLNCAIKSLVYTAGRILPAEKLICLDADMLVLGDLQPAFRALDSLPEDAILVCREANEPRHAHLEDAIAEIYQGTSDELTRLAGGRDFHRFDLVINDGFLAARPAGLNRLDAQLRQLRAEGVVWMQAAPASPWRNQFLCNLALAQLGTAVEWDPVYNLQMFYQQPDEANPARQQATWRGRDVRVLHFCGPSRAQHDAWRSNGSGAAFGSR